MDSDRFEHLVRALSSRRSVLAAFGVALARVAPAGAASCRPTGKACDPHNDAACCSGICKKRKGGHKCAPAGKPFGCATSAATDFCASGDFPPCPDGAFGDYCIVARTKRKRKPLCVSASDCMDCRSDADCAAVFGDSTARCIEHCAACAPTGAKTVCVIPA